MFLEKWNCINQLEEMIHMGTVLQDIYDSAIVYTMVEMAKTKM